MDQATHNKIVSFIWGIVAGVLNNVPYLGPSTAVGAISKFWFSVILLSSTKTWRFASRA